MDQYVKKIDIRWADLDPNFHVLHSKYYDFGAHCRMSLLTEMGITERLMQEHLISPIIFREECFFKKELLFGDEVFITVMLDMVSEDYRKWSMVHDVFKNEDTIAAAITIDCAWMDILKRKLTAPPGFFIEIFNEIPKTKDFRILP